MLAENVAVKTSHLAANMISLQHTVHPDKHPKDVRNWTSLGCLSPNVIGSSDLGHPGNVQITTDKDVLRDIITTIFCREVNATSFTSLIKVGGSSRSYLAGGNSFFSTCLLKAHLLRTIPKTARVTGPPTKAMEKLIITTSSLGRIDCEPFIRGLLEWRNTPKSHGFSPAEVVFGHQLRSLVPAHHQSYARKWLDAWELCKRCVGVVQTCVGDREGESKGALRPTIPTPETSGDWLPRSYSRLIIQTMGQT
ncbi:hypothetical protein OUZ56_009872 [Daphnia magna]|uniref:Uncharacterized protein n=1 Tax=Daphnia magna TaxID=35525 RepID=A0ABR0AH37_9CRUS|nr:hypothetical protein OUZ56_009872 [Daphnia magna]